MHPADPRERDALVLCSSSVVRSLDLADLRAAIGHPLEVVDVGDLTTSIGEATCVVVSGSPSEDLLARTQPDVPILAVVRSEGAGAAIEAGVTDVVDPDRTPPSVVANRVRALAEHGRDTARLTSFREAFERVDNMFSILLHHAPISIYFKDEQARHVAVSDHLVESLRGSTRPDGTVIEDREDILGLTDIEVYDEEAAADAYEDDLQVIESGEPVVTKEERWDRTPIEWYATTKVPWRDTDGEVVGILGFTIDIVDEKRSERLEEFVDVLTHDIKSPLNVAQGQVELLQSGGEHGDFETLAEALSQMSTFIDNLLSLAREGRTVGELRATDTDAVVAEAWQAVETGDIDLEADWERRVLADRTRLVQLFENLFRNAVEHGEDVATIAVGPLEGGPDFFVEDDGPGIPESERDAVFEWGHSSSDGTGFGLAIVRQIALGHGWAVRVAQGELGGARFEFRDVEAA